MLFFPNIFSGHFIYFSLKQPHYAWILYVGVLISLWLFLFAAQPKELFLDGIKKLEQRSHKCVQLRGEYVE
jgi:hypothetical protein